MRNLFESKPTQNVQTMMGGAGPMQAAGFYGMMQNPQMQNPQFAPMRHSAPIIRATPRWGAQPQMGMPQIRAATRIMGPAAVRGQQYQLKNAVRNIPQMDSMQGGMVQAPPAPAPAAPPMGDGQVMPLNWKTLFVH